MQNLLNNVGFERLNNAAAAAQTEIDSATLDMLGADAATFIVALGDVSSGCVLTATVEHGDESNGSDAVATEATVTFTAGASDADHKLMIIDVIKPQKRYCRVNLTRTTANAVVDGIIAVRHQEREKPVTQGADVLVSGTFNDPSAA